MNQFTHDDGTVMCVDKITVAWIADESPDLSFLEKGDPEYEAQDKARLATYGDAWHMQGCVATAEVSYPCGGGNRRLETLSSGGLWGIESDSGSVYLARVESEQVDDLIEHLSHFGIVCDRATANITGTHLKG